MALVYMIKSNKEIKGSTVTSINYLEDDIQKVLIIIDTTLFHSIDHNDCHPTILSSLSHSIPTTLTSLCSLSTSSAVAPQDLSHYYSFCLEHISPDYSVTHSPNSAGICIHAPSSERASLPLRLGSHHHSFPTPATLPLALLYFSYNPYHPQT